MFAIPPYIRILNIFMIMIMIMIMIQGTLNSNQDFRIDKELKIELTHVVVPEGSGYTGKHTLLLYLFLL